MESLLQSVWLSSPQSRGEPQCPGAPWQQTALQATPTGCTLQTGFPGTEEGLEIPLTPLGPKALSPWGCSLAPLSEIRLQEEKKKEPRGVALADWEALQPGPAGGRPQSREPSALPGTGEGTVHRLSLFAKVGGCTEVLLEQLAEHLTFEKHPSLPLSFLPIEGLSFLPSEEYLRITSPRPECG